MSDAIHTYPVEDWIEHVTEGFECECNPTVEYVDPETGLPLTAPHVIHNRVGPPQPSDDYNEKRS